MCIGHDPVFLELQSSGGEASRRSDSSAGEKAPERPGMQSGFPSGKVGEKALHGRHKLSKDLEVMVLSSRGIGNYVLRALGPASQPQEASVSPQV